MLTALKSNLNVWGYKKDGSSPAHGMDKRPNIVEGQLQHVESMHYRELYASEVGPVVNASADPFAKFIEGLEFGPQLSVSSRFRLFSPQAANF